MGAVYLQPSPLGCLSLPAPSRVSHTRMHMCVGGGARAPAGSLLGEHHQPLSGTGAGCGHRSEIQPAAAHRPEGDPGNVGTVGHKGRVRAGRQPGTLFPENSACI